MLTAILGPQSCGRVPAISTRPASSRQQSQSPLSAFQPLVFGKRTEPCPWDSTFQNVIGNHSPWPWPAVGEHTAIHKHDSKSADRVKRTESCRGLAGLEFRSTRPCTPPRNIDESINLSSLVRTSPAGSGVMYYVRCVSAPAGSHDYSPGGIEFSPMLTVALFRPGI